jgi:hypothetical protein
LPKKKNDAVLFDSSLGILGKAGILIFQDKKLA